MCGSVLADDAGSAKIWISGWSTKIRGRTAIVATMELLRRYSRSSLRKIARMRIALILASCRSFHVLVDQLEVDVLQRVARLADREHVGALLDERAGRSPARRRSCPRRRARSRRRRSAASCRRREAAEDAVRIRERGERPDGQCLGEQPLAELVGATDRAQGRVEDRDAVAEPLGLVETVRREEDRDPAPAEPVDQLVDVASGDRIQAGGRLVEEQHLRVAEQRPRQARPAGGALWTARRKDRRPGRRG